MKLLHITRQVTAAIVERLRQANPGLDVTYRDLSATPLSHLSGSYLAAFSGATPEPSMREDVAAGQAMLDEFLAADMVVINRNPRTSASVVHTR
jgi:FMN-dependent NADH-azoreductase